MEDAGTSCKNSVDSILHDLKSYTTGFENITGSQELFLTHALEQAWLAGRFYMNMKYIEEQNGSK